MKDAWNITTGSNTVRVGIIDSGIDWNHPDLEDNFDFYSSRDFSNGTVVQGSLDSTGHGTAVAGVIGAVGDNNKGIAGVCWDVELVSLKVTDETEFGYSSNAMAAIDYAASDEADIDILNMSVGWTGIDSEVDYYNVVFSSSINNFDGLVVCAAGNHSSNLDTMNLYPATYPCSNIITVGAMSRYGTKYSSSNYSTTHVDIFAPGDYILTTFARNICNDPTRHNVAVQSSPHFDNNSDDVIDEGVYHYMDETSIATPYVTGTAALMLSINPNLTAAQLKDILIRSAEIVPGLEGYCVSDGRLDAYRSVWIASNYRFDYRYSYYIEDSKSHGVICDTCECSCREDEYTCGNGCDFVCDPCEGCHLNYTELHKWGYTSTGSSSSHQKYCVYCGYTTTSSHNWAILDDLYKCLDCNQISAMIPDIQQALPPISKEEELTE